MNEKKKENDFLLKFYDDFSDEELLNFPPLEPCWVDHTENIVWDGEKWVYIPID